MKRYTEISCFFLGILITFSVISCSHAWQLARKDQKSSLKNLITKYWNSKLTGDMITCYQLEEPDFRKKVPVSVYVRGGNLIYKSVQLKDITINGENATADIGIEYIIPALGSKLSFKNQIKDKWVKKDGNWYHRPQTKKPYKKHKGKEVIKGEVQK